MIARFLGFCILAWFVIVGSAQGVNMILVTADTGVLAELHALGEHPFAVAARLGQVIAFTLVPGVGSLALLFAYRRWLRRA